MKKKKKEAPYAPSPIENAKKFNWKLLITLIGNTIIIFGIYRYFLERYYFEYIFGVYVALTAVLIISYVIYNRGFSRRGVTIDMLPDTMTPEQKTEFIADGERRIKKSKWMLTLILPFIITFTCDAVELFLLDNIKSLFS